MPKYFKKIRGKVFKEYLEKGEKIKYILRQHPAILIGKLAKNIALFIVFPTLLIISFPVTAPFAAILIFWGLWRILIESMNWYGRAWIITDLGVVCISSTLFFRVRSTRIEYQVIGGVSYDIRGIARTIFNYGDIYVSKMGSGDPVIPMENAYKPQEAESAILRCQRELIQRQYRDEHKELKKILVRLVDAAPA